MATFRGLRLLVLTGVTCHAAAACVAAEPATGPQSSPAALAISEDGRRIVRGDGSPFFWLADTAWELFHRLDREEAELYLRDRAAKGFTVIQAVVLAELDGLRAPNPYGDVPLHDLDPSRPNEAYFRHVDHIVDRASQLGLVVAILPTWGDKFNQRWGVGPEVFTPENARAYGEFLGSRYQDRPVVWVLGGDRDPESDEHLAIVRAMAEGIRSRTGGRQLMTYHPMGGSRSDRWFHDDAWLDFNMFQSGHQRTDIPNFETTSSVYGRAPVKPVIDGEPRYEDHPINWRPEEGWFDEFDVRQAAYWSVLAGAAGHTYGDHNIWQMWDPSREPVSSARTPWREALAHPGAAQMGFMRSLFESRPFLDLEPEAALVTRQPEEPGARQIAALDRHGRYLIAYSPYGYPLTVRTDALDGANLKGFWFDPRTGAETEIGQVDRGAETSFRPPGRPGRGNDWVLLIEDVSAGFARPGTFPVAADRFTNRDENQY